MADPKSPEDPAELTARVKELTEKVQELKSLGEEIKEAEESELLSLTQRLQLLKTAYEQKERLHEQQKRELAGQRELGIYDDAAIQKINDKIEKNKEWANTYAANQAAIDKALENTEKIRASAFAKAAKDDEAAINRRKMLRSQDEQTADGLIDLGARIAAGTAKGFAEFGKGLLNSPQLLFISQAFPGAMNKLSVEMKGMAASHETAMYKVAKSTGFADESLKKLVATGADPLYFERTATPEQIKRLEEMGGAITGIGLRSSEIAPAMEHMVGNINAFRPSFMRANEPLAVFTANLVGSLTKVGVASDKSTATINKMNKTIGLSPKAAVKAIKSLVSVADSLEISAARAFENFNAQMPTLSQYGEQAIEVYARLEAQALATGLSVDKLSSFAQGLDTFKGAADVAQRFNAVMGDTYLSVSDLADADHDEKILMIQDAMARTGVSFETADRKMQQVIASTLGLSSVEEARQLLSEGARDDYEIGAKKIDTTEKSQEALKEQIEATMTTIETFQKNLPELEGGLSKWVTRTKNFAVEGANIMKKSFEGILSITQDMEAAAQATVISYSTLSKATGDVSTQLAEGDVAGAVSSALKPAGLGVAAELLTPEAPRVWAPIPKRKEGASGPSGAVVDEARLRQLELSSTGNGLLLRIADALQAGLTGDLTADLVLDDATIAKITGKVKPGDTEAAVQAVRAEMKAAGP